MARGKRSVRERRMRRHAKEVRARRWRWAAVAGVVLLLAGALLALSMGQGGGDPAAAGEISPANVLGSPDAPVQVVEFGDFGCPSCRAWHNSGIKDQLQADFGDQISFTFRHFPVITRQSPQAAEAAQCAAEQDAFWQYHDSLYEQAPPGGLAPADLKLYATRLGLDGEAFADCLDSGRYEAYVERDVQAALDLGARGTPSFYVNGEAANLFSYEAAVSAVRQQLP